MIRARLERVFITQVPSRFNPLAPVVAERGNEDCLVASSLMTAWLSGHGARPDTPAGVRDAMLAAREIATGEPGTSRALTLAEGRHLLDHLGVSTRVAPRLNDALDTVRAGKPAIVVVRMHEVGLATHPWTRNSYHARSAELGIEHWPDDHAIVVADWDLPSETYGVLDPMAANGPFRATATELAYSNLQRARARNAAGLVIDGS